MSQEQRGEYLTAPCRVSIQLARRRHLVVHSWFEGPIGKISNTQLSKCAPRDMRSKSSSGLGKGVAHAYRADWSSSVRRQQDMHSRNGRCRCDLYRLYRPARGICDEDQQKPRREAIPTLTKSRCPVKPTWSCYNRFASQCPPLFTERSPRRYLMPAMNWPG